MKFSQSVLFAHEEETLALEPLLRSDLLLGDRLGLLYSTSCLVVGAFAVLLSCLSIDGLDVSWHLEFVKDQLSFNLRFDLTDDTSDFKALMGHFLQSQTSKKLIFNEDLLNASIGAELETGLELISALNSNIDLVIFTESFDLVELSVEAVDQD